jgi:G:T-mismatch repair DNA endonuclease (very short patch repair protein)
VLTIWECETRDAAALSHKISAFLGDRSKGGSSPG